MSDIYRSVFDIIGPVMIGPSSSHTAGAVAIGREGNKLFGSIPKKVTVHYYGSFAQTHRGHGTDYAIAAGILGFEPDDLRVPQAPEIARKQGVDIRFVEEPGDSPIHHPNTAILDMSDEHKKRQLSGCSIGGGAIEIRQIIIDNKKIYPAGPLPIIIYIDKSKDSTNVDHVTSYLAQIAPFKRKQEYHADNCIIYEYDIENYIQDEVAKEIHQKYPALIYLY